MGLTLEIDGIEDDLAAAVAERVIEALPAELAGLLQQSGEAPAGDEILGVAPFKLYPVAYLAERWDVSKNFIRRLPQDELPRADWHGREIRYRGLDILRYEGVDVSHLLPANVHSLQDRSGAAPSPPQPNPQGDSNQRDSSDVAPSRPYNRRLPEL